MSAYTLHLLRHGAPETPGLMLGRTDAAPTSGGIAACVARVEALGFEQIVTSDLQRCARAANAIAAQRNLTLASDTRWREMDFGDWDGHHPGSLPADAMQAFWEDPDTNPPPQGESWSALQARITAAIAALPKSPTLVVTHGGAIRAALAVLCSLPYRALWAFDLPYAACISLRIWPEAPGNAQIIGLTT